MPSKRPTTVEQYIRAAPREGQAHLRRLRAILKSVAPDAEEVIKWGVPFFVEPRFLFAFSAHKAHASLAATPTALEPFRDDLGGYEATKNMLRIPYEMPVPEALVRKIAAQRLRTMGDGDGFW